MLLLRREKSLRIRALFPIAQIFNLFFFLSMPALTFFTVTADLLAVVTDSSADPGADPDLQPVTGLVVFTPRRSKGDPVLVTDYTPRPTGFLLAPIRGRFDQDGQLRQLNGDVGVRLLAGTPALGLASPLVYDVAFSKVKYDGSEQVIAPFAFQAPAEDVAVNLATVERLPAK